MEFDHGGDLWAAAARAGRLPEELLDFSVNSNPLGPPPSVRIAAERALADISRYPDPRCRAFRAAAGEADGLDPGWIFPGGGAAEVLFELVRAIAPRSAALPAPSFSEYAAACRAVGCGVSFVPLAREDGFWPGPDFLSRLPPDAELVFCCSPNNPTGRAYSPELLLSLLAWCEERGARLLLDESFLGFCPDAQSRTLLPLCAAHPSLIVLRSMTKLYAVAGLRLGYAVCSDEALLARVWQAAPPWMVSGFAAEIGCALFAERDYVRRTRAFVQTERDFLAKGLAALGAAVCPSDANFLLVRLPGEADVGELLLREGILARRCEAFPGLDERDLRVCVRKRGDNLRLLAALKQICSKSQRLSHKKLKN